MPLYTRAKEPACQEDCQETHEFGSINTAFHAADFTVMASTLVNDQNMPSPACEKLGDLVNVVTPVHKRNRWQYSTPAHAWLTSA